ncbi:MAG: GNAT family N-acetyltransferase [Phycisphaerales bacterium]|jgi:CelD/BcsL family acetyltransferase involved in cellulose biosynthesis|nr:GNAT family N-acetyltransferase [Phycisphaerales bacterium]
MSLASAWSHHLRHSLLDLIYDDLRLSKTDGVDADFTHQGLRVECRRNWPDDPELAQQWDQLHAACPLATPFHGRLWQQAIHDQLASNSYRLILVYEGNQLIATMALRINAEGFLETVGEDVSDYLEPLIHPFDRKRCWIAMLAFLRDRWDRRLNGIHLHNLRPQAPCLDILPLAADEQGFNCIRLATQNTAFITLGQTWEMYQNSLNAHQRKELRRKLKKARSAGAQLICCDDPTEIEHQIPAALKMMASHDRSKRRAVRVVLDSFLTPAVGPLAKAGSLQLHWLMIGEEPAAVLIVLPTPAGPMLWNCGYDERFSALSPGIVTFALTIQQAIDRQMPMVDLLRGPEPYKLHLGAVESPLYRITLTPRDLQQ